MSRFDRGPCGRARGGDCERPAEERLYPACRVGWLLIFGGVALVFLGFAVSFWLTLAGAALVLIGYLVTTFC